MEPKSGYSGLSRSASIPTGWIAAKPLTEKRGDALKIIYYENIGIGLLTHTIETKKNALNVVAQMRVSLNEVLKHSTQSMAPSSVSHLGALHKQIEKLHNLLELRSYDSSEGLELILKSGGTIDNEIRKRKWIDKHREHISHVRRLQAIFRNRQKKQKPHKWHCLSIQFFTNFRQGDAYFKSELSKILKKRVKIITEIIETERNYFELMSLIPTVR